MNELSKEKVMTVNEISKILCVSPSSIKRAIKRFFPNKMKKGKTTYLNEIETSIIKKEVERHHNHLDNSLNTQQVKSMINYVIGGEV